jgi:predicted metal-dependent HD superfamily phosphohydrolase
MHGLLICRSFVSNKHSNMDTFKKYWIDLSRKFTADELEIEKCFNMLMAAYSEPHRHYHNIEHINSMIQEINAGNNDLSDPDALLFATWFHDVVYNPRKHDNEAASAEVAARELKKLSVPEEKIEKAKQLILATANHMNVKEHDLTTDFFLDCDLKILGAKTSEYLTYAENIRQEYKHVMSFIYKRERKKILKGFLESQKIYRTEYFRNKYEEQARKNISLEIQNL